MRLLLPIGLLCMVLNSNAQPNDTLNTAKSCRYMTQEEKDMIRELNLLRSDPRGYIQYITPLLIDAKKVLLRQGKGTKNYSLTYTYENGLLNVPKIDTTWYYINEENLRALNSLISDLKKLKKLSILQPDSGIYLAAKKHAADQHAHEWTLSHVGSDGSDPWDRIRSFSPAMYDGNENIGMIGGNPTVRDIVLLLLVDSGITGYGHRDNILDRHWTHVACTAENYRSSFYYWLQEFGAKK